MCSVQRCGEQSLPERDGLPLVIHVAHGEGADLLVGRGVQQGEQPDEPFMRVDLDVGRAAKQLALRTGLKQNAGEPGLRTQPQREALDRVRRGEDPIEAKREAHGWNQPTS